MKKLMILLSACALFAGCKTNEANYRQAYEVAKQRYENADTVSTSSHRLERYAQPHPKVIDGDTLQLLMQPVSAVAGEGLTSSQIRNYNVVVGQFRQIFNARQMRQRLIASGYASTAVLASPQPLYYVVTMSTDTASQAAAEIRRLQSDASVKLRAPLPFVISPR